MKRPKQGLHLLILLCLTGATLWFLCAQQPISGLVLVLEQIELGYLLLGLGFMLVFVGCEAACSHMTLTQLGQRVSYRQCMGYAFIGFYVSSITPSSTGGQPAQMYYMSRDGISPAYSSLDMLLISVCYQVGTLLCALVALVALGSDALQMGIGGVLLLIFGGIVLVLLTVGMLLMMFSPDLASRLAEFSLQCLVKLRIVKEEQKWREKLVEQLEAYRQGAICLRNNRGLLPRLLALTLLQLTALYGVPYMVYLGFGLSEASFFHLAGAQALVNLAVGILPLPGSVGVSEGVALATFSHFYGGSLVTPAVLVSRGISFYAFLLISGSVAFGVHWRSLHPGVTVKVNPLS